jgi:hypothetical protein
VFPSSAQLIPACVSLHQLVPAAKSACTSLYQPLFQPCSSLYQPADPGWNRLEQWQIYTSELSSTIMSDIEYSRACLQLFSHPTPSFNFTFKRASSRKKSGKPVYRYRADCRDQPASACISLHQPAISWNQPDTANTGYQRAIVDVNAGGRGAT